MLCFELCLPENQVPGSYDDIHLIVANFPSDQLQGQIRDSSCAMPANSEALHPYSFDMDIPSERVGLPIFEHSFLIPDSGYDDIGYPDNTFDSGHNHVGTNAIGCSSFLEIPHATSSSSIIETDFSQTSKI